MSSDNLGELIRTFGPNEEAYQRSLLVVMSAGAFCAFGGILLVQRALADQPLDWLLSIATVAAFGIAGKLFLVVRSNKFSVEVWDQGLRLTSLSGRDVFRWDEIAEIEESELESSFPDTEPQICVLKPDDSGFVANANTTLEIDELVELIRSEASKRSIWWTR